MRDTIVRPAISATRLPHLDAVRGIAAFAVVIHHAFLSLPAARGSIELFDRIPGLRVVSLGRPAVVLFFVLSGFVLTRSLQGKPSGFVLFAGRRLVRLVPGYWAAIGFSLGAFCLVPRHSAGAMSEWFNGQWGSGVSATDILRHFVMFSSSGQYPLDHVAWSLVHELRLSILLPIFVLFLSREWCLPCLVASGLIAIIADRYVGGHPTDFPPGLHGFLFDAPGLEASLVLTARFSFDFALGFALATHWNRIDAAFTRRRWVLAPLLLVGLALLSSTGEVAMAIGAVFLIAAVISSPRAASGLSAPPLEWLGRVSYSLYLVHLPVMLSCGLLLDGIVPAWTAIAIAILISLPAAEALYRMVESPSIRWSRALGAAKTKTLVQPVLAAA